MEDLASPLPALHPRRSHKRSPHCGADTAHSRDFPQTSGRTRIISTQHSVNTHRENGCYSIRPRLLILIRCSLFLNFSSYYSWKRKQCVRWRSLLSYYYSLFKFCTLCLFRVMKGLEPRTPDVHTWHSFSGQSLRKTFFIQDIKLVL